MEANEREVEKQTEIQPPPLDKYSLNHLSFESAEDRAKKKALPLVVMDREITPENQWNKTFDRHGIGMDAYWFSTSLVKASIEHLVGGEQPFDVYEKHYDLLAKAAETEDWAKASLEGVVTGLKPHEHSSPEYVAVLELTDAFINVGSRIRDFGYEGLVRDAIERHQDGVVFVVGSNHKSAVLVGLGVETRRRDEVGKEELERLVDSVRILRHTPITAKNIV